MKHTAAICVGLLITLGTFAQEGFTLDGDNTLTTLEALWEQPLDNDDHTQGVKSMAVVDDVAYVMVMQRTGDLRGQLVLRRFDLKAHTELPLLSVTMPGMMHLTFDASANPDTRHWYSQACTLTADADGRLLIVRFRPDAEPKVGASYTHAIVTIADFDPHTKQFCTVAPLSCSIPLPVAGAYRTTGGPDECTMLERVEFEGSFAKGNFSLRGLVAWSRPDGPHPGGDYTFSLLQFNGETAIWTDPDLEPLPTHGQCIDAAFVPGTSNVVYTRQNVSVSRGDHPYFMHLKNGDRLIDDSYPSAIFADDPADDLLHKNCRGFHPFLHGNHTLAINPRSNNALYGMTFSLLEWPDPQTLSSLHTVATMPVTGAWPVTWSSLGVLTNRQLCRVLPAAAPSRTAGDIVTDFCIYNPGSGFGLYRLTTEVAGSGLDTPDIQAPGFTLEGRRLTVSAPAGEVRRADVYNLTGARVASAEMGASATSLTCDLSPLASGIYVVTAGSAAIKIALR